MESGFSSLVPKDFEGWQAIRFGAEAVLCNPESSPRASRLANVRDRYDPTVPAYVLRHRRTRAIFNPNANPRFVRLLRITKYLAVPRSLVSCCKYLLLPLCHGRGREFESRRPRHSFSPVFMRVFDAPQRKEMAPAHCTIVAHLPHVWVHCE